MKTTAPAAAGIDAPSGIQFCSGPRVAESGDHEFFVPLHKDATGTPDRVVAVTVLSTTTVAVIEYKLLGNTWVFDPDDCAVDNSITLTVTISSQGNMTAFAIDSPAGTGDRVLFISTNDVSQAPDTFEMNSIVLTPGSSSLTAVLCVISEDAADRQPDDADFFAAMHIPLTTSAIMTIRADDAYFATITESTGTYTFDYDAAKVTAIDTSINVVTSGARSYSGIVIGSQVVLANLSKAPGVAALWELTPDAVLTQEFNPWSAAAMGAYQATSNFSFEAITAIGGIFAVASPIGGGDSQADISAYVISTFPLDDI